MRRRTRLFALALALAPIATGLTACSSESQAIREVQAAIENTRLQALRFRYTQTTPDEGAFQVQGLIEDDFRYKARLLRGSTTVFDEVVNDDAIAVRFAEPDLLGAFVDEDQRDLADLDTNLTGVTVVDALEAKRWVLDPVGAPSLTDATHATRNQGADPVFDALGVFAYVEQAIREAFEVHEWSKDDLNPAYRTSEDVFPRPDEDTGIKRYDLRRPFLPPIGATSGSASDSLPATKHFRKMAIYVKDGVIIRVMERVEVTGRAGDDFEDYLSNAAEEAGYPKELIEEGRRELRGMSQIERSDALLAEMNLVLDATGNAPISVRTMTLDILDLGADDVVAELPLDVIEGSLAILQNRGAKAESANASGSTGASAGSQSDRTNADEEE